MANAVDRLFEEVLSNISDEGMYDSPDRLDVPFDEDDYDILDRPPESDETSLYPITDELNGERIPDTLLDRGVPHIGISSDHKELINGGLRNRGLVALAL
jgi:hypothetical protein